MRIVRSLLFYLALATSTLALGITAIVIHKLTKDRNGPHKCARLWGNICLWAAGVTVRVEGLENIDPHRPYVYAPNHQSWFDIFALLGKLPIQFRWLAKEELFKIPVLGATMSAIGYIPIDRSDRRKAFVSMNQAAERIKSGTSIVIFPEGTRSPDGVLQEFKKGGFILAIKSQQPVVPVSISGSHKIMRKGDWMINPGVIHVRIGAPIDTTGFISKDRDALSNTVREAIEKNLLPEEGGKMAA